MRCAARAARVPARRAAACVLGLLLAAAGVPTASGAAPDPHDSVRAAPGPRVAATDDRGRRIELARPARRVLTLAPHATELVYAAGGGAAIVGTVDYSDHPPEARQLPRVGDAWQLHPERIVALRPDLVVAWLPGPIEAMLPTLAQAGIPVFYAAPATLAGIADDVERLARLLGTETVGAPAVQAMRARLARLREQYAQRPTVRVFVQVGTEPLYTLNDAHVVGDVLRLCGARNVFGEAPAAAPMVDLESVIAARPDAFILARDNAGVDPTAAWRRQAGSLPAVRENRIILLPPDHLYRPGPRLLDAAEAICASLEQVRR